MIIPVVPRAARPRRAGLVVAGAAALALSGLVGCAEAEQAARSATDQVARDAVVQATAAADGAASGAARAQAQQALGHSLASLPGTCDDVLALPASTREEQALTVLRAFWLADLVAEDPPADTVEQFEEAVVEQCRDARETGAATVLREVWDTGSFGP
ncbi:hypothetical protein [Aquipuribacter sp. MA13-6]|uniref:hypothetical protein n=1 Tax=unclassified Aquipuribacter TaxID=2635084 RepID=UPI003EEEC9AD